MQSCSQSGSNSHPLPLNKHASRITARASSNRRLCPDRHAQETLCCRGSTVAPDRHRGTHRTGPDGPPHCAEDTPSISRGFRSEKNLGKDSSRTISAIASPCMPACSMLARGARARRAVAPRVPNAGSTAQLRQAAPAVCRGRTAADRYLRTASPDQRPTPCTSTSCCGPCRARRASRALR